MFKLLYIVFGGALGAGLRFSVTLWSSRWIGIGFPWGTLAVNLLGSFAAGFVWAVLDRSGNPERVHALVLVGMLGAFTTFSAYALDSMTLFQDGKTGLAITNILANNVGSIAAVFVGYLLAKSLIAPVK